MFLIPPFNSLFCVLHINSRYTPAYVFFPPHTYAYYGFQNHFFNGNANLYAENDKFKHRRWCCHKTVLLHSLHKWLWEGCDLQHFLSNSEMNAPLFFFPLWHFQAAELSLQPVLPYNCKWVQTSYTSMRTMQLIVSNQWPRSMESGVQGHWQLQFVILLSLHTVTVHLYILIH